MNSYKELRQEFAKDSFRKMLKDKLGNKCANCGSKDLVEYHHVVPLVHGGTNNLGNIVPLCHECHLKAHNKHNHGDAYKKAKEDGRVGRKHKMSYEECLPFLEAYFSNEIGTRELIEKCKYKPGTKISSRAYVKRYKKEHNIEHFYNNVDLLTSQERRLASLEKNEKN